MADISQIQILDENIYDIKDATARAALDGHTIGADVPSGALFTDSTAYCSTGAGTSAKAATCTQYHLTANQWLHFILKNSNSYEGALTLGVNSTGAKPIYINGTVSSASNCTLPAGSYIIFYDGTNYHFRTDGKLPGSITGDAGTVGGHTVGVNVPSDAVFTDTTYESKTAAQNGTDLSLVTTGEKYAWNNSSGSSVTLDSTLSVSGQAADAKAVGDAIEARRHESSNLGYQVATGYFIDPSYKRIRGNSSYSIDLLVFNVTPGVTYTIYRDLPSDGFRAGYGDVSYETIIGTAITSTTSTVTNITNTVYASSTQNVISINIPDDCNYLYVQLLPTTNSPYTTAQILPSLRVIPKRQNIVPDLPTTDGNYVLQSAVSSGTVTLSWTSMATWSGGSY